MNGTIVHNKAKVDFNIISSPLQAVIRDGAKRYVNHNETIILDASLSRDPDFDVPINNFT